MVALTNLSKCKTQYVSNIFTQINLRPSGQKFATDHHGHANEETLDVWTLVESSLRAKSTGAVRP